MDMTLKERVKKGERLVGMYVQLSDISIARIAAMAGYDFIWVDTEHSYMSYETLLGHVMAIRAEGVPVVVRAPQNDLTAAKKILEMGVDGIIFPMVRSAAEAKAVTDFTFYPPYGQRGFGPMNAIDYGFTPAFEYTKKNNKESGPALVGIELKTKEDYPSLLARLNENGFSYKVVNNDSTLFDLLI